jgi:hypothetical protein
MNRTAWLQDRRMPKFRDDLSRWESGALSIEHIPSYSPEARGRSERMFGTLAGPAAEGAELGPHQAAWPLWGSAGGHAKRALWAGR